MWGGSLMGRIHGLCGASSSLAHPIFSSNGGVSHR